MDPIHTDEVLVLDCSHAFVRVADPSRPAPIIPETLVLIEQVPFTISLFLELNVTWLYARFMLKGMSCQALEFDSRHSIPLSDLPAGLTVNVRHIPLYAQPAFETKIWPYWQTPSRKKWWV